MELDRDAPGLVGRGGVWGELAALLDPARPEATVAMLVGPAGIGKSSLIESFAGRAVDLGYPLVRTSGEGKGAAAPYSALRPLLERADLDELPEGQRQAVRSALRGAEQDVALLALRTAVCAICAQLATNASMVLVVDDVDRVDAPSLDLLLTLASVVSWGHVPVVALFASRTERVPVELAELVHQVTVPPLSERESERLFDGLPGAPSGSGRLEILRRAAGNPLALREYGDWADLPGDGDGVAQVYARRVRELPELSLLALTLAAAGERNFAVISRAEPAVTLAAWQPAEEAGLITVTDATVRFRHPLVERAVLEAAGPEAQRQAHRALAAATPDPRRALWHRAAAADSLDPGLAAELIDAAGLLDGAGTVTAISLLEQASLLLPAADRPGVLLAAAGRAGAAGRLRWAREILHRTREALVDAPMPAVEIPLMSFHSWLETMAGRPDVAAELLVPALDLAEGSRELLGAASTAGFPVFLLGDGPLRERLRAALGTVTEPVPQLLFPRAVVSPDEQTRAATLGILPSEDANLGALVGAAAALLDEPEHAVRLLTPATEAVVESTAAGVFLAAPGAAGWALVDTGRWVEAERWFVPLMSSPVAAEAELIRGGAHLQLAVIAYGRGRPERAGELLGHGKFNPLDIPALGLRLRWAQGTAAAAAGEHDEAYRMLALACAIGHPWRLLALPDLIAAARQTGRLDHAARITAELRERWEGRWLSGRARRRLDLAAALLDEDPAAGAERMASLLDTSDARRWPFERAVLATERADRLRRAQQPRPAQDVLVDALDTFERLGAAGWAARVHAELRTGMTTTPGADPFATLSAQQEQIVRLAADGMTNREIGARLFLSPRTVGSHLYRVFPDLGVANRTQLSDLLATADRRRAGEPSTADDRRRE
ncbi:LuxR family transcriptional regulator [Winogradskya consettensis]|uniref:Transcriptional regulator n=1 Tax=Winogradskya consettensis TaxID=113560 RepID=A0A919SMR7_9ACTN|nr:LuxR family transcriptional regulator [Actinoplanes consettensis]GIM74930.1 transcriptional regulator [Actinoplanes consettensis]